MFLLQWASAGLAAAFIIIVLQPGLLSSLLDPSAPMADGARTPEPPPLAAGQPLSYADAVEAAAPAVVNLYSSKLVAARTHPLLEDPLFQRFFGDGLGVPRQQRQNNLGSGVIIRSDGYVLTNNHLIAGADEVWLALRDGRAYEATVVGRDPETDLAVLHAEFEGLPAIRVGDPEQLRVGDVVLAIGNPFGVGQTVTQGIVSATSRNRVGINTFENFIQTDAAINPGNSGGALINARGELVGINTAIYSASGGSQGIGFAIPANLAIEVLESIIRFGAVVRGWLGVEIRDLTPALAESLGLAGTRGVLVGGVMRGGPADQAGLYPGDILTHIVGDPVSDARHAIETISGIDPGTRIQITAVRNGRSFTLHATVGQRPRFPSG